MDGSHREIDKYDEKTLLGERKMTTKKIEIHAIQSFPAHCLNRGQNNEPKSMIFGGTQRARVSSQCWKRATRLDMQSAGIKTGIRSRQLAEKLLGMVPGANLKEAHELISYVFAKPKDTTKKEKKKVTKDAAQIEEIPSEDTSSVLIFISPDELDEAAKCLSEKAPLDQAAARIKNAALSADISLFGRMLSEHKELCVDAACQVAHAFSTHAVIMEDDFFTAVDDLALNAGETATAMLDNVGYNASVFYRYAAIDMPLLTKNLNNNPDYAKEAARAFIRAFLLSLPSAKQNSFAANNMPSFAMLVGNNAASPVSLANAFVKPIEPTGDIVAASITAMIEHAARLNEMYDLYEWANIAFISDRETSFDPWAEARVTNLQDAVIKVFGNG